MRQGEESDELHLVDRGHVAIRRSTGGASFLISVLGPGGAYGESAFTARLPRLASAIALDEVEVRVIPREGFEELRERVPVVERFLVELLDWELNVLMTRLVESSALPAERRVLRRVVELARAFQDPERHTVIVPLAQEDVASLASVTRPTANRVLQAAAQRGLLQLGWRRVTIPDVEALEAAAYTFEELG
jgi:CRP-like cAMP-binding protein